MPVEDFVKYMTQAKGQFLRKYNKEVEDIKIENDSSEEITFALKGIGETGYTKITIKKNKD